MRHGPCWRFVGPAQVRVAQAVGAQVLPGAAQQHHLGACAGVLGVQRLRRLRWASAMPRSMVRRPGAGRGRRRGPRGPVPGRRSPRRTGRWPAAPRPAPGAAWPKGAGAQGPTRRVACDGSMARSSQALVVQQGLAEGVGHKGQRLARHRQDAPRCRSRCMPPPCPRRGGCPDAAPQPPPRWPGRHRTRAPAGTPCPRPTPAPPAPSRTAPATDNATGNATAAPASRQPPADAVPTTEASGSKDSAAEASLCACAWQRQQRPLTALAASTQACHGCYQVCSHWHP